MKKQTEFLWFSNIVDDDGFIIQASNSHVGVRSQPLSENQCFYQASILMSAAATLLDSEPIAKMASTALDGAIDEVSKIIAYKA